MTEYQLIDSGDFQKFEKFGPYRIVRPCVEAVWKPKLKTWDQIDAFFVRKPKAQWILKTPLPFQWEIQFQNLQFLLMRTDFGHLGLFPEYFHLCQLIQPCLSSRMNILNLFAYTGMTTIYAATNQAKVCHVDASKQSVTWAKKNAELNQIKNRQVRWIVDDVIKFLKKEVRRKSLYDGIILSPPTFGRGSQRQVFKIERDILPLLDLCRKVLSKKAKFIVFSCHSLGWTPVVLKQIFRAVFSNFMGQTFASELIIEADKGFDVPSGSFVIWKRK